MQGIDDAIFINLKIKGVVGIFGVVRVSVFCFLRRNDFPYVLNDRFTFKDVLACKNTFSVNARLSNLDSSGRRFFG